MNTAEVLRAARALIDKPEKWTQGAFARNSNGDPLWGARDKDAAKWCASGAIELVGNYDSAMDAPAYDILYRAAEATNREHDATVSGWNDAPERTHAEILAAFDQAIAIAEASHE